MRRLVMWVLKNFWFPILIFALAQLGKRYEWASDFHAKLSKFR